MIASDFQKTVCFFPTEGDSIFVVERVCCFMLRPMQNSMLALQHRHDGKTERKHLDNSCDLHNHICNVLSHAIVDVFFAVCK